MYIWYTKCQAPIKFMDDTKLRYKVRKHQDKNKNIDIILSYKIKLIQTNEIKYKP